jgi:hypothetical protein
LKFSEKKYLQNIDRDVRFFRMIQKSPYMGKMVFYVKKVQYVDIINLIAHTVESLPLIANSP